MGMASVVSGQQYDFKIYSVNDGLPHGQVHDMVQTKDGFIWIATNGGGLSRFDGNNFKTYTTDDGLQNNAVQNIFADSKGRLWVANYPSGVVTFQGDSLVNPFPNDSLSKYEVWQINEFNENELWFGTYQGGIFIRDNDSFRRLKKKDGLISNAIWDFKQFDDDRIWITTQHGISVYQDSTFTNYTVSDGVSGREVYQVTQDQKGNKWFATSDGVTIWDGERFRAIKEINGIELGYVFDVETAADGKVWIGTESKGVFIYDGNSYKHLTRENGLSSNYIYTFFVDANNNMWVGTDENGLSLYRGDSFIFYGEHFGFSTVEVLDVNMDSDGILWVGTTKGLNSYDGQRVRKHLLPEKYKEEYIWESEELPNGNQLFVMHDNTILEYDGEKFQNYTKKHNLDRWFIYDLVVDSKNRLWIGTDEGAFCLDNGELRQYSLQEGMVGNIVHHIYEDSEGEFYFATTAGMSKLSGQEFTNITINDGLAHNRVNHITEDEKGNIWLGTVSGVSVLKPGKNSESHTIYNFGKEEGMGLVNSHFVWFDEQGYLWQGTNGGLNRLDVPNFWESGHMNLTHYKLSEEGLGAEFNFKAVTTDNDSNAWFGSMDGALKLNLKEVESTAQLLPPKAFITAIEHNLKPVDWERYTNQLQYLRGSLVYPQVTFPYGKHTYTFTFTGLNYRHPENIEYRYKMKGFEDEWAPLSTQNSATYTNLEPGEYTFMVQAVGGAPRLESEVTQYQFSVAYPFWHTYWFYAIVTISIIGFIVGYIRVRLGILERNRLKELVEERTKELKETLGEKEVLIKEIHHRVKNNLAVISGLLELQQGYSEDEFSRKVLTESQRRVQSISMIHEKLYQSERLAEVNFSKYVKEFIDIISYSFNYKDKEIIIDIDVDNFKLGVDQGVPCGLILNELVSNAYEHAFEDQKQGRVNISMKEDDTQNITLVVEDDGRGLPEDFDISKSDSLGLSLIETLSMQLNANFEFVNTSEGTRFVLTFKKEEVEFEVAGSK